MPKIILPKNNPSLQHDKRNISGELPGKLTDLGRDGLYLISHPGGGTTLARLIRFEGVKPDIWVIPAGDTLDGDVFRALAALVGGE